MFSFLYNKKKANLTQSEQDILDSDITNTDSFVVINSKSSSSPLPPESKQQNQSGPHNLNMQPHPVHYLHNVPFNIPEFLDFANIDKVQSEIDAIFAYFTKQIQILDYDFILEREVASQ